MGAVCRVCVEGYRWLGAVNQQRAVNGEVPLEIVRTTTVGLPPKKAKACAFRRGRQLITIDAGRVFGAMSAA